VPPGKLAAAAHTLSLPRSFSLVIKPFELAIEALGNVAGFGPAIIFFTAGAMPLIRLLARASAHLRSWPRTAWKAAGASSASTVARRATPTNKGFTLTLCVLRSHQAAPLSIDQAAN
jgi:hypothetical protein